MRIGVNLLYLIPGAVGGTETYAAGLLRGIAQLGSSHEFVVFVPQEARSWPLPETGQMRRHVCAVRAERRPLRYAYEQLVLPFVLRHAAVDLVHSLGYVGPLVSPCPSVVTVHDVNFDAIGSAMDPLRRAALGFFVRNAARRADTVVAVSGFANTEIRSKLGVPAERIRTIHEAPDEDLLGPTPETVREARERWDLAGPYVVAFSSRSPHKNVRAAMDAVRYARERLGVQERLVLIGHPPDGGSFGGLARGDHWLSTGFLDRRMLGPLLGGARALLFLSSYEGFGLPVLEAMSLGVPVICSHAASLPEVGGDAAVYVHPDNIPEVAEALAALLTRLDDWTARAERGRRHAAGFTWTSAARKTLEVYEDIAGRRRRR